MTNDTKHFPKCLLAILITVISTLLSVWFSWFVGTLYIFWIWVLCQVSVQFSPVAQCLTLCDPHGLQHTRLPCLTPTPRACANSCPSSRWCHATLSSSVTPSSSCKFLPSGRTCPTLNFLPRFWAGSDHKNKIILSQFHHHEESRYPGLLNTCDMSRILHQWSEKWKCWLLSCVQLFGPPGTVTLQAPLFMEFSRQEY